MINFYQTSGQSLAQLNIPLTVSEVHGLCCGLLCGQSSSSAKTRWFTEMLDAASLSPDEVAGKAGPLKSLDEWFGDTLGAMNDPELDFTPALPSEEIPVVERMRALGDFCAGFTYGIGLSAAQRGNQAMPEDTREIIEDFQAIDAADALDQPDEQGEALSADKQEDLYVELLEYVRVGVLLILEELRPVSPAKQEKPS